MDDRDFPPPETAEEARQPRLRAAAAMPADQPPGQGPEEGVTPPPAEAPPEPEPTSPQQHLIAIVTDVVTALEHLASDRPAGNYLRQLTDGIRARIAALREHV